MRTRFELAGLIVLAMLGLLSSSCSDPRASANCVPGQVVQCPCLGAGRGAQTCSAAGTYGACNCGAPVPMGDASTMDATTMDAAETPRDAGAAPDDRPPNPVGDGGSVTRAVGPDGGVVEGFGVTVTIPPGALPAMTEIRIVATSERAPSGYRAFSPVYRFEPDGTRFSAPVRVSLPFVGDMRTATVFWSAAGTTTRYERVGGQPDTAAASATITHFSQGFVADGVDYTETPDRSCAAARVLSTRLGSAGAIPSSVGLFFSVEDCFGRPITDLRDGDFTTVEDGTALSSEGRPVVLPTTGSQVFVTLSIDLSASSRAILPTVVAAARRFVDEVEARRVPAQIGIELFAGGVLPTVWQPHTLDLAAVRARLDAVATATPEDPSSTNLYGAVVAGVRGLELAEFAFEGRNSVRVGRYVNPAQQATQTPEDSDTACSDSRDNNLDMLVDCDDPGCAATARCRSSRYGGNGGEAGVALPPELELAQDRSAGAFARGYLVVFTDGSDTAGRATLASATAAAQRRRNQVIAVGLRGADFNDAARTALQSISGRGFVEAVSADVLERDFRYLATRVAGQTRSTYLLGYCSPRRSGTHSVGVSINGSTPPAPGPGETREGQFDATGFGPGCAVERFAPAQRCGEARCGGLGCGACDDRTEVCVATLASNNTTGLGSCVNRCAALHQCGGATIVTPQGNTLTCADERVSTQCAGACRDLTSDRGNCGACGTQCPSGARCVAGACTCPGSTQRACSGACRDLSNDVANCGACGNACATGASCVMGACSCSAGQTVCAGACRDLTRDLANCGACGNACATNQFCRAGACVVAMCPAGMQFMASRITSTRGRVTRRRASAPPPCDSAPWAARASA